MKKYFYKLVRDKIPEIIESKGGSCVYDTLNERDFIDDLDSKLQEEVSEYLKDPCVEELADIAEVLLAILDVRGISLGQLEEVRKKKLADRGGFTKRILLISTDDGKREENT